MKLNRLFLWTALSAAVAVLLSCTPRNIPTDPKPQPQDTLPEETVELEPIKAEFPVTENWIFDKRPNITFRLTNPNAVAAEATIKLRIRTDKAEEVCTTEERTVTLAAHATEDVCLSTEQDLAPGFYRALCYVGEKIPGKFGFGVNPLEIVSAPDKQADYDEFWATAKEQLAAIDMNAELTELPSKSNAKCKTYLVEMNSVPDGLTGEPVVIRGYYLEPQDGKQHPVILHFFGYDSQQPGKLSCPSGNGEYAELYVSHRGQQINNRTAAQREPDGKGDFVNIYGDWFAYHFGDRDSYYYRGAFMDCVQAVRFMASRETSDMSNLFAEGSSQGGALCYAAAALSDIPFTAIAPNVAFLGDFPDYFDIVSWPGNTAKANKGSMTDEEMYAFLSYFDTKNLASRISCAVWATSGLQDGTCPPHTNVAPFNNLLSTDKQMNFYPEMQHAYPPSWNYDISKFFKDRIK